MANEIHEANRKRWDAGSELWAKRADSRGLWRRCSSEPALVLSDRELEIARGVVDGLTHKEIGAQLYISPKTVEHHVARIRRKVQAGSRAEMLAILRDLVGTP